MKFLSSLIPVTFAFICVFKYASSILCFDCNSKFDHRCGEEFDSFSLGVVNCSLRDPPEHISPTEPTICRTIKMEIYGKVRVVRSCGYLSDNTTDQSCRRQSGNGDLFVTYCSCGTDLCNSASVQSETLGYTLAVLLIVLRI